MHSHVLWHVSLAYGVVFSMVDVWVIKWNMIKEFESKKDSLVSFGTFWRSKYLSPTTLPLWIDGMFVNVLLEHCEMSQILLRLPCILRCVISLPPNFVLLWSITQHLGINYCRRCVLLLVMFSFLLNLYVGFVSSLVLLQFSDVDLGFEVMCDCLYHHNDLVSGGEHLVGSTVLWSQVGFAVPVLVP